MHMYVVQVIVMYFFEYNMLMKQSRYKAFSPNTLFCDLITIIKMYNMFFSVNEMCYVWH